MVVLRFSGFTLSGPKKLRFNGFTLTGTNTAPKLRFNGFTVIGLVPVRLRPIADVLVDAFTSVTITAVPGATSPTPDGYSWRQVSGPTVSYLDNGSSITFVAPPAWAGATVVFGVTGYVSGSPSPEVTASTVVIPHQYWKANVNGTWSPRRLPVRL